MDATIDSHRTMLGSMGMPVFGGAGNYADSRTSNFALQQASIALSGAELPEDVNSYLDLDKPNKALQQAALALGVQLGDCSDDECDGPRASEAGDADQTHRGESAKSGLTDSTLAPTSPSALWTTHHSRFGALHWEDLEDSDEDEAARREMEEDGVPDWMQPIAGGRMTPPSSARFAPMMPHGSQATEQVRKVLASSLCTAMPTSKPSQDDRAIASRESKTRSARRASGKKAGHGRGHKAPSAGSDLAPAVAPATSVAPANGGDSDFSVVAQGASNSAAGDQLLQGVGAGAGGMALRSGFASRPPPALSVNLAALAPLGSVGGQRRTPRRRTAGVKKLPPVTLG
mmetsp:Transcript_72797/g.194301  ORF Transcript_72797/g.194301 Transcript_72797/m.194301 type:complete len:344 (-) Transcript_72797:212-1243(-)